MSEMFLLFLKLNTAQLQNPQMKQFSDINFLRDLYKVINYGLLLISFTRQNHSVLMKYIFY
jgi:hypothetical protein